MKEQVSEAGPGSSCPACDRPRGVCVEPPFVQERELTQHRGRGGSSHGWSQQEGKAPTFQVTRGELSHTPKRLTWTRHPQRQASRGRADTSLAWFVVDPSWNGLPRYRAWASAFALPLLWPLRFQMGCRIVRLLHRATRGRSPGLCPLFALLFQK